MSRVELGSALGRAIVILLTILLTWAALLIGRLTPEIDLEVGDEASQTFFAPEYMEVIDEEATGQARTFAYNNTPTVYSTNPDTTNAVISDIDRFFQRATQVARPPGAEPTTATTVATTGAPPPTTAAGGAADQRATTTSSSATTSTTLPPPPVEEQITVLQAEFRTVAPSTIETVVALANAEDGSERVGRLRDEAVQVAQELLEGGIRPNELSQVQSDLLASPPFIFLPFDFPVDQAVARQAAADVVSAFLQANETPDEAATEERRQEAREAVVEVEETFIAGQPIVTEGEPVSALQLKALRQAGLLRAPGGLSAAALLAMVTVLVAVLAFYLARFRPDFWARPKRVMLFGLLILLSALTARAVAVLLVPSSPSLGYLVPAAAFGFMAAILFDARMAVLTAVAVGTLTGLATFDPEAASGALGYSLFALLAPLVPVPFVSAISSRADLRRAVWYSGLALAPMAGSIAWVFQGQQVAIEAIAWGVVSALISGFLAMGLLPFLETLFDITTALTLLDLTDRNHPALQLLEEKALGTFNHSLMVGNLADGAARAIGANPLLARAAAYYHDLGKTEDPWFFIENQFGGSNPHDSLHPEESAAIIRQHVEAGGRLAEQYRIPSEVAEGVMCHHGTGLMRYFYHKARERYGQEADPSRYRHQGRKPRSKEMTILMLADAAESACRAMVLNEEPTVESIHRVIERVVGEKQADNQLDESALSLGELRRVKEAFAGALIGHYHQRIPYPDFPETQEELEAEARRPRALPESAEAPPDGEAPAAAAAKPRRRR
ncbi:MAG: HDIG domain-containing protein [Actinomycetota bacterium]|nr:HDIG domain-containing protein [Actinomycetota bacterium]